MTSATTSTRGAIRPTRSSHCCAERSCSSRSLTLRDIIEGCSGMASCVGLVIIRSHCTLSQGIVPIDETYVTLRGASDGIERQPPAAGPARRGRRARLRQTFAIRGCPSSSATTRIPDPGFDVARETLSGMVPKGCFQRVTRQQRVTSVLLVLRRILPCIVRRSPL
jgi:hypothetical protein